MRHDLPENRTNSVELPKIGYALRFGGGTATGSINALLANRSNLAILTVRSDATLTAQFGSFIRPEDVDLRDELAGILRESGLTLPDGFKQRYVNFPADEWVPVIARVTDGLREMVSRGQAICCLSAIPVVGQADFAARLNG